MRTLFFISLLGGAWWTYSSVPGITVKSVDWLNMKVIVVVHFKEIPVDAGLIFSTFSSLESPIRFSRYSIVAQRSQFGEGSPNVLRISVHEGNTIIGQSVFIDFDAQTITPNQ